MDFAFYSGLTAYLHTYGPEKAVEYAASLGFTALEPLGLRSASSTENEETARALRRAMDARDMHAACYSVGISLLNNPQAGEAFLMDHLRYAAAIGSPYFHHTLITNLRPIPGMTFEAALNHVLPLAERIARRAAEYGMSCLYEPQGMYFNGVENVGRLLYEMKRLTPNVGICADVGNIYFVDEDILPILEQYGTDVRHVHLKDYRIQPNAPEDKTGWYETRGGQWLADTFPGTGAVDFAQVRSLLRKAGYTGAFGLENEFNDQFPQAARRLFSLMTEGEACLMRGKL